MNINAFVILLYNIYYIKVFKKKKKNKETLLFSFYISQVVSKANHQL